MYNIFRLIIVSLICLCTLTLLLAETDETREPPLKYKLLIDGKAYDIVEKEPLKLTGTLKDPTVKLEAEENREFTYGGVSFLYPRGFSFEPDIKDVSCKSWTLTGTDTTVLYINMTEELTLEDYVQAIIAELGKKKCNSPKEVKVELLGKQIKASRFKLTSNDVKMDIEIIRLPTTNGSKFLYFQFTQDETGKKNKVSEDTYALILKSIAFKN